MPNVQLVWQQGGSLKVLDFGRRNTRVVLAMALAVAAGLLLAFGAGTAQLDSGRVEVARLAEAQQRFMDAEARLAEQEDRVRAYAARLSRMQAHIIRLDALGRQLTDMAGLDPSDFSFDRPPPQGGRAPLKSDLTPALDSLGNSLGSLSRTIQARDTEISQLAQLLLNRQLAQQVRPDGHPVLSGYISSFFGRRTDPFTGHAMVHKGVDYAGREGSAIVAVADGVVAVSRYFGGFGNFVEINHGQGYVTRYAHNQKNVVRVGDRVERGQTIALLGSTGRATGPNLHFEVLRDGKVVDPMAFISDGPR